MACHRERAYELAHYRNPASRIEAMVLQRRSSICLASVSRTRAQRISTVRGSARVQPLDLPVSVRPLEPGIDTLARKVLNLEASETGVITNNVTSP